MSLLLKIEKSEMIDLEIILAFCNSGENDSSALSDGTTIYLMSERLRRCPIVRTYAFFALYRMKTGKKTCYWHYVTDRSSIYVTFPSSKSVFNRISQ